jgi:hypothetical protein
MVQRELIPGSVLSVAELVVPSVGGHLYMGKISVLGTNTLLVMVYVVAPETRPVVAPRGVQRVGGQIRATRQELVTRGVLVGDVRGGFCTGDLEVGDAVVGEGRVPLVPASESITL